MKFDEGLIAAIGISVSMIMYIISSVATMRGMMGTAIQQAKMEGIDVSAQYAETMKTAMFSTVGLGLLLILITWIAYAIFRGKK